jgi:hypothetical protein
MLRPNRANWRSATTERDTNESVHGVELLSTETIVAVIATESMNRAHLIHFEHRFAVIAAPVPAHKKGKAATNPSIDSATNSEHASLHRGVQNFHSIALPKQPSTKAMIVIAQGRLTAPSRKEWWLPCPNRRTRGRS